MTVIPLRQPSRDFSIPPRIQEMLMPESMFETASLGANYFQEQWADYLLHVACGTAKPKQGEAGMVLAGGEPAAAAWASLVLVHDNPEIEAMGPDGLLDGHVLLVSVSALNRRASDPAAAAQWMREGAYACARLALGASAQPVKGWTAVSRQALRQVLAAHPAADWLLDALPDVPEQDAWRYASAMLAYGNPVAGELAGLARNTQEVELDRGWANREWAPFLTFESDTWQWKKNGALLKGIRGASSRMADLLISQRTPQQKIRMAHLLLNQLGGSCSMTDRVEFVSGLVAHSGCTEIDRAIAIEVSAYYDPTGGPDVFSGIVESGWLRHHKTLLQRIKSQSCWMRGRQPNSPELFLVAAAGLVDNLHQIDGMHTQASSFDRIGFHTLMGRMEPQDAADILARVHQGLEHLHALSAPDVHELARCLPSTASRWILRNPIHAAMRDTRTGGNLDIVESLMERFDGWIERSGPVVVASRLAAVISAMPQGHSFDLDTVGWLDLLESAGEDASFFCVLDAAAKVDPGFANKALMGLAMNADATPAVIEHIVGLGGTPWAMVDIQYADDSAVPERILDVGLRHERLAVRACFRRMASQQPKQEQDNVITLRSPRVTG